MNDDQRTARLASQSKRAQGGVGAPHLHEGGGRADPTGPRDANDPGTTRFGDRQPAGTERRDEAALRPSDAGTEPRRGPAR